MKPRNYRNILFISLSQFGMNFSFNFVMIIIPFLIQKVSPHGTHETLMWTGLILGSTSGIAAIVSTFWGAATSYVGPKRLYITGLFSHAVIILLMGFVTSLPLLLVLRILQGILGGVSTVGLIIVSSSTSRDFGSRDIGFFQNMMTVGQLIGPPAGALVASAFGYGGAFLTSSIFIFLTLVFCSLYVVEIPHASEEVRHPEKGKLNKRVLIGWGLCFTATVQLMFLPGILPNVFEAFQIEHATALKWAGTIVMLYTASAMAGTYFLCRLSSRISNDRLIVIAGSAGIVLQSFLGICPDMISFAIVRIVQTAMIAAIMPLTISFLAADLSGKTIGFLNSGRFAGNALGPIIGTSVFAFAGMNWLCIFISTLSLIALICLMKFSSHINRCDFNS